MISQESQERLAVFDMDGTLLQGDSVSAYLNCLARNGLITEDFRKDDDYHRREFMNGTLDIGFFYRHVLSPLRGWSRERLRDFMSAMTASDIRPLIYREARDLVKRLKDEGFRVIIVSATFDLIVETVAREIFSVTDIIATKTAFRDGVFTGEPLEPYSHQSGKALLLNRMLQENGWTLRGSMGFGDTVNDIEMLTAVEQAHAVNARGKFRDYAVSRGWKLLEFSRTEGSPEAN
ncbi:HAD family hydrolase [Succinimonas sp.]|uniref:HAD family hydrolase n=1 Tax=Succinimonas sp. TaxID=1936151 RepID=UPI00386E797E